jgi:hypothetical protein
LGEELDDDVEFWQQHARVLKRPTHRRWNDDGWAFLLYGRASASDDQVRSAPANDAEIRPIGVEVRDAIQTGSPRAFITTF